jgi:hypothetical protein
MPISEGFPKAFKRFEQQTDIRNLTFNEIIYQFMIWQEYRPTNKQQQAIKEITRLQERNIRIDRILRRKKYYNIYRDVKTGRFTKNV